MRQARLALCAVCVLALGACARTGDADSLVASARQHLAKGEHRASIIQLRNALQKDPRLGEARFLLGLSLLESGDLKAAEAELKRAVELGFYSEEMAVAIARTLLAKNDLIGVVAEFGQKTLSDRSLQAELRAVIGAAELRRNRAKEAQLAFADALSLDGGNVSANLGLARLAAVGGDLAGALKRVEAVIPLAPGNLEALTLKADLLVAQGHGEAATQAYRTAIAAAPREPNTRLTLIAHLMRTHAIDEAASEVEGLAKVAPGDSRLAFAQGKLYMEQRRYPQAREAMLQVLKVAPEHLPSLMLAGRACLEAGAYAEAEGHLRKAAFYAPESIEAKRLLATTYLRLGQSAAAMVITQELLAKASRSPGVLALAAETYLASGDIGAALKFYDRAKALAPDNTSLQTRLAMIRMAAGDARRGYAELEAAAAISTDDYQPDLALVATHLRQKRPDRALAALETLQKKQPNNPVTHDLRGMAWLMKRDYAKARASFEQALELNALYLPAVTNLARLDIRERKSEAARKRFEEVIAKDPGNEDALLSLAVLLRLHGAAPEEVERLHRQSIARNPASPRARSALVNYYLGVRDFKSALAAAQDAAAALPNSPAMVELLGLAQMSAGEHRLAVATFMRFADMLPQAAQPLMMLATAQMAARQPDEAVRSLRSALRLRPELTAAQRDLASIYVAMGRTDEALKEARALQASRPKQAFGYVLEGEIHAAQRDWESAERVYREATKRFGLAVLLSRAHQVMVSAGKAEEAETLAERWVKSHPKDGFVLNYLADRDLAAKRYESAARRYSAAAQRAPDNVHVLNNLAWVLQQLGQPGALQHAERAHELAPDDPQVMDTLGGILLARGETERALELLGRASAVAPQAHELRLNFARALLKANRKAAARQELQALAKLDKRNPVQQEASALLGTL